MALINVTRDGVTYAINTNNVLEIVKYEDGSLNTYKVYVAGYDDSFSLTEAEYTEFENADYSGGGGGGTDPRVDTLSADVQTLSGSVSGLSASVSANSASIDILDEYVIKGGNLPINNRYVKYNNSALGSTAVELGYGYSAKKDTLSYTIHKEDISSSALTLQVELEEANPSMINFYLYKDEDITLPTDFTVYLKVKALVGYGSGVRVRYSQISDTQIGNVYVLKFVGNNDSTEQWYNSGWIGDLPIVYKDRASLDARVTALEASGGGSSMVYDTTSGELSGAKDQDGNDVTLNVNTITISF